MINDATIDLLKAETIAKYMFENGIDKDAWSSNNRMREAVQSFLYQMNQLEMHRDKF